MRKDREMACGELASTSENKELDQQPVSSKRQQRQIQKELQARREELERKKKELQICREELERKHQRDGDLIEIITHLKSVNEVKLHTCRYINHHR